MPQVMSALLILDSVSPRMELMGSIVSYLSKGYEVKKHPSANAMKADGAFRRPDIPSWRLLWAVIRHAKCSSYMSAQFLVPMA